MSNSPLASLKLSLRPKTRHESQFPSEDLIYVLELCKQKNAKVVGLLQKQKGTKEYSGDFLQTLSTVQVVISQLLCYGSIKVSSNRNL